MKPTLPKLPRPLAVKQVAEELGVCGRTIRRWIDRGELRVHRLGRLLRVSEPDLIAFVQSRGS